MRFTDNMDKAMKELISHGAFLTSKSSEGVNTMTISWGFIGMIWAKPFFIALVRPQRYTKKIIEKSDSFTISIPYGKTLKEQLKICGTQSGGDIDKSEIVEFSKAKAVKSPVVRCCNMYYECKIVSAQEMNAASIPKDIIKQFYKDDFHTMYIGEIVECYEK
jgi:Conserved protein/domain typically associated with flavoprotein oxygenases, DIM6/NTAB family